MPLTEVSCHPMNPRHGPSLASAFSRLSGRKFTHNPDNNTVGVQLPANTAAWIFHEPPDEYKGTVKGDSWAVDVRSENGKNDSKSFALHLTVDGQLVRLEHTMGTVLHNEQGLVRMELCDSRQSCAATVQPFTILMPEGHGSKISEYAKLPGESPWSIQSLRLDSRTVEEKSMPVTASEIGFEYLVHEIPGAT